ncbi:MAG: hypothetical protein HQL17_03755 [Candidatus Omnitrophica bacterium]|nr:hypothetical protein [Candidatus Omnitrophota bacterium]
MSISLLNRRGSLMFLALMLMTVMAVFVSVFLYTVSVTNKITGSQVNSSKAFYLAEAGLNKAFWYLQNQSTWFTAVYPNPPGAGVNDPKYELLGDGSYTIWVKQEVDGSITVVSKGVRFDAARIVHQKINLSGRVITPVSGSWGECLLSAGTCP